MSVMDELVAVGFDVAMQMAGASIDYIRGENTLSALDAIPSEERYEVADEEGVVQEIHSRDYLLTIDDLVIGGAAIEPRAGDRIVETVNGQTLTFEVFPVDRERCFRYRDHGRQSIRIHTKRVS